MADSLLSPVFLGLSVAAPLALASLRGIARQLVFLILNLLFVSVLLPPIGVVSTLAFAFVGFVATRLVGYLTRRALLVASLAGLFLFVYMRDYDFLAWVLPARVLTRALATVGLSFMFFKIAHVIIEVRSGTQDPPDVLSFLNYCFNFTTFMMGPIQRFGDYREQWSGATLAIPLTVEAHLDALLRILVGFLKAYVIAAWIEQFVLPLDVDAAQLTAARVLVGIYAFYFYLYLSFAGYCDVAIGVGSLMGVRPPENFNAPFLATNISEFWLRQHRSLTLWLTDYVFSPLYKTTLHTSRLSSRPLLAASLCLIATMLVSGLWHGTTSSFLLFGLLHGLFFVIFRTWDAWLVGSFGRTRVRAWRAALPVRVGAMVLTFHATALAFVCFRHDIPHVLDIYARLAHL